MRLAYLAGLPPIRLHDLRHGTASLMLVAGVEMKVVQETLGHTSSAFTSDTYTSVYPQGATAATEKTAALLFGKDVRMHLRFGLSVSCPMAPYPLGLCTLRALRDGGPG